MKKRIFPLIFRILFVRGEINTIPFDKDCSSSKEFDYAGLVCSDETSICPPTSLRTRIDCSLNSMRQGTCQDVSCSPRCSSSHAVSKDQNQCVPCSGIASLYDEPVFDDESNQCTCNNPTKSLASSTPVVTKRLVEIYNDTGLPISYDCLRCPDGTAVITAELYEDNQHYYSTAGARYTADPTICAACPHPRMYFDTDYNCKCQDGYILTGEASLGPQSCIERLPTVASGYEKAIFTSPVDDFTLNSLVYSHYYLKSASQCEYFQNSSGHGTLQSCQALGNLCVLNMYNEDSAACKQYLTIAQLRTGTYHNQEDWKQTLPWLYYSGDAGDVMNDRGIKMKMAFRDEDAGFSTELSFKLAKYNLDGKFVGMEDLANQLKYCSNENGSVDWTRFGQSHRLQYSCDLTNLVEEDMFFYDMYVVDQSSEACKDTNDFECLYPVPVLNRNLVERDAFPNMNISPLDELNDRYTRRFFLFDNQVWLITFQLLLMSSTASCAHLISLSISLV